MLRYSWKITEVVRSRYQALILGKSKKSKRAKRVKLSFLLLKSELLQN